MYNKGLSLIYESPLGTGRFCNILPSKGSQLPLEGKYVNVNIHFSLLLYGVYSLQCTVQYSKGVWGIHKLIEQELAITMQVKIQCLHKFHFLSVAVLRLQRVRQEKSSIAKGGLIYQRQTPVYLEIQAPFQTNNRHERHRKQITS